MAITVQEAQVIFSADGLNQVQTKAGQAGKALDRTTTAAGGLINKLKSVRLNLGGVGSMLAGLGAGTAAIGMLKSAASAETLALQMKVLTGSAGEAAAVIERINTFAAETPFRKMEIGDAARMLLAFNGSADTVVDELRMLGDIAAATGQPLTELAELYGKAKVQGRLFGEDINQLTGRGIPIITALAKQFGVTESQVKKLVEQGQVGFPQMQQALASMTAKGGQFNGMTKTLSTSTAGMFSTFMDNVEMLGTQIGSELLPELNKVLEWANSLFTGTEKIKSGFRSMKESVVNWFTETQEKFEGVGVVIGVTAVHMVDIFKNAFADIQSLAAAAFEWITSNAMVMVDNMGIRIERMKLIMGLDAGPEAMMPLREFEAFQTPNLKSGDAGMTLREKIDAELEVARKLKNEQKAKGEDKAKGEEKGLDMSGLSNPNNRMPGSMSGGRAAGKSETFSAEALFASLRESALSKQIGLQTKSVNLQSQAVQIAEAQLDATKKINMGLA